MNSTHPCSNIIAYNMMSWQLSIFIYIYLTCNVFIVAVNYYFMYLSIYLSIFIYIYIKKNVFVYTLGIMNYRHLLFK